MFYVVYVFFRKEFFLCFPVKTNFHLSNDLFIKKNIGFNLAAAQHS